AAFGEAAMDALDDVAALPELAQGGLGLLGERPLPRADLVGEAESRQLAQTPDLQGMEFVGLTIGIRSEIDDAGAVAVARELAVEAGPALGLDLALERAADLVVSARPQLPGDEVARPVTHALFDIVARDDEVLAVLAHAAHDQMDVRVLGVPMIDGDPFEA